MEGADFISLDPWSYARLVSTGIDAPVAEADREPIAITFKIRHTPEFTRGALHYDPTRGYRIDSEQEIQGIAPGQYAVLYDEEHRICFGSGMITRGY